MSADRTVHVVVDDATVRRSLERLLDTAGFRVVSYDSSSAFLEAARGLSACRVLLDIQMPGVDGLAVQARLNRLGVPLPVIVMTAHGDVASAVQAMKAGAVDFLEKPFDDETLLNGIEAALAKAGRRVATASLWRRRSASRPLVRASGKFSMVW
jgi:two-component system response regulator FixJ